MKQPISVPATQISSLLQHQCSGLDPQGRIIRALLAMDQQQVPGVAKAAIQLGKFFSGHEKFSDHWSSSALTLDGFPCELTFGTSVAGVRYAVEPPATVGDRFNACEALLAEAGAPGLPDVIRNRFLTLHQTGPLSYGAWIGGHHDATSDHYKWYVEVPRYGAEEVCRGLLADYLGRNGPHTRYPLRMLGYDPNTARLEFYFRVESECPLSHFPPMSDAPLHQLASSAEQSVSGFSIALNANGEIMARSRYIFPNTMLESDLRLRRRLLASAHREGWTLPGYAAVSALLSARSTSGRHGLLTWITRFDGPGEFRLGLSPPHS